MSRRNEDRDGAEVTLGGSAFHARAPWNARSPSEDRRVAGTTTSVLEAERSRCREIFRADTMQTAIHHDAKFESHSFWHWQPVQLLQQRCNVVVSTDAVDQSRCRVEKRRDDELYKCTMYKSIFFSQRWSCIQTWRMVLINIWKKFKLMAGTWYQILIRKVPCTLVLLKCPTRLCTMHPWT